MTLQDAIELAHINKGHIYTTEELWAEDENCILVDNLGNLIYGDGEPVTNIDELEPDGWYDVTDEEPVQNEEYEYRTNYVASDVLWDDEDF